MPTVYQIIVLALLAAFILLLLTKTGWRYALRDHYDLTGFSRIAKMLDCDFCFSFWLSLILALVLAILYQDLAWVMAPIFSVPLTRFLL